MTQEPPSFVPVELTKQQKIFTMLGTLLGLLLAALDNTIVATAGPYIQKDLQIEPSLYVWITTSYLVASTVLVPIYGKLSDLYGRRKILLVGIFIFLAGSFFCGVSQSTLQLILSRAVQGVGSAALFTTAFAVVADIFPPTERGKYQGLFGAVFGLSSVIGPFVGGFITDVLSWHWVFFINLPLGAIAIFFILSKMPPLKQNNAKGTIDISGAVSMVVALVPLLLALSLGKRAEDTRAGYLWGSWEIIGLFGLFLVGFVSFLLIELRAKDPLLDLSLFRNKTFAVGNLASLIAGASFLAPIIFLPLFMVNVVGLSATSSGLTTVPLTFGIVFGNIFVGQLVSRIGRYKIIILSSLLLLVASFVFFGLTLTSDASQTSVTLKMVLVGLGLGPSIPLFTLAVQNAVSPDKIGVATSTATFSRQMGSTIGIAIVGTIFATVLGSQMNERLPTEARANVSQPQGGEGASSEGFDVAGIKEKIKAQFEETRRLYVAAFQQKDPKALEALRQHPNLPEIAKSRLPKSVEDAQPDYLATALTFSKAAEEAALAGVDQVNVALKESFTQALSVTFFACAVIALIALLLTFFLPELPLRRTNAPVPVSE